MLVKCHYKQNPLEICWLDVNAIMTIETGKQGGADVVYKNGLTYTVHEEPDTVATAVNAALENSRIGFAADADKQKGSAS